VASVDDPPLLAGCASKPKRAWVGYRGIDPDDLKPLLEVVKVAKRDLTDFTVPKSLESFDDTEVRNNMQFFQVEAEHCVPTANASL
jgi:hypothetical protein